MTTGRSLPRTSAAFCLAVLLLASLGCMRASHQTLTIAADGSATVETVMVYDRTQLELHLPQMEQHASSQGLLDEPAEGAAAADEADAGEPSDTDSAPAADTATEAPEGAEEASPPDTDEPAMTPEQQALAERVRRVCVVHPVFREDLPGLEPEVQRVVVDDQQVRVEAVVRAEDLASLFAHRRQILSLNWYRRMVLEQTDDGDLRLRFTGVSLDEQDKARVRLQLKNNETQLSFTVAMPGAISESDLPESDGSTTSFTVDATDSESLAAYSALMGQDITIVAAPGEFPLDQLPIDTDEHEQPIALAGRPSQSDYYSELPMEQAVQGYRARPERVTTTRVHRFPAAQQKLGDRSAMYGSHQDEGCQITGELIAPRERKLLKLLSIEAERAVDDRGRPIPTTAGEVNRSHMFYHSSTGEQHASLDFQLALGLPEPGAQAIEECAGTAIVVSFSDWKQQVIGDPQADETATIPLDDVLEGATLKILEAKQPTKEDDDPSFRLVLSGPSAIQACSVDLITEHPNVQCHSYTQRQEQKRDGGTITRTMTLSGNVWNRRGDDIPPVQLRIRRPLDLKREEVTFTLTGLDLL